MPSRWRYGNPVSLVMATVYRQRWAGGQGPRRLCPRSSASLPPGPLPGARPKGARPCKIGNLFAVAFGWQFRADYFERPPPLAPEDGEHGGSGELISRSAA